jgi:hypothetical protein
VAGARSGRALIVDGVTCADAGAPAQPRHRHVDAGVPTSRSRGAKRAIRIFKLRGEGTLHFASNSRGARQAGAPCGGQDAARAPPDVSCILGVGLLPNRPSFSHTRSPLATHFLPAVLCFSTCVAVLRGACVLHASTDCSLCLGESSTQASP